MFKLTSSTVRLLPTTSAVTRSMRMSTLRGGNTRAMMMQSLNNKFQNQSVLMASQKRFSGDEEREETYEEYTARYVQFFSKEADDLFELSRGLNNAFNTDIVPAPEVLVAALKCARRLNSLPLATRVLEALREKLDGDDKVYAAYLDELKPTIQELGVPTPEELGR